MFITLEGVEGSGKTTLARSLSTRLEAHGHKTLLTREPGGTVMGTELRALLLGAANRVSPAAELFLFLADRAQHVNEVIAPALNAGATVLCDRYTDSTIVYQGMGRGFDQKQLHSMCALATENINPDITFVLDLDVYYGLERAAERHKQENTFYAEGRFEAESIAFHDTIRQGFLTLAAKHKDRIVVLDSIASAEDVLDAAWRALNARGFVA